MDDQSGAQSGPDVVRCPQCAVVVQPTWDWCHGCGYDPDGLKAAADAAARQLPGIVDEPPPPPPPPAEGKDDGPEDGKGGGLLRRRRYRT